MLESASKVAEEIDLEEFILSSDDRASRLRSATKALYDVSRSDDKAVIGEAATGALKTLLVDGYDDEQVWEQIHLYSVPALAALESRIDQMIVETADEETEEEEEEEEDMMEDAEEEPIEDEDGDEMMEGKDGKDERGEEEDEKVMFEDMYEAPKDGEFDVPFEEVEKDIAEAMGDDLLDEGGEEEHEKEAEGDEKTPHEMRIEAMKKKIEKLEDENVEKKHWSMMGEVSRKDRPKDSLLDTYIEFQTSTRQPPVVSHEVTVTLIEMIKRRIQDGSFDDVQRRQADDLEEERPTPKRVPLSEEKLAEKRGLGEVYEEEFRAKLDRQKQNPAAEPELTEAQKEVEREFKKICAKLNALSNFHYKPKMPSAEVRVLPNAPAVAMEEVVPIAVSTASLLAPEEVYEKKPEAPRAKEEMSREEKRTAHANVKRRKHEEAKRAPKATEEGKVQESAAKKLVDASKKMREEDVHGSKQAKKKYSSAAFFATLEREKTQPAAQARPSSSSTTTSSKTKL